MRRAILALVTLLALGTTATAGVPLFGHVSCAVVRFYVAKYSEVAAETWARGHGASAADIEAARRCLHGANVQTASSTMRSQVIAPVTGQERAQNEPVERHPNQDALHIASVQAHPDDPKSDIDGNKPGLDGSSPPKDIEDRSAPHASHEMKDHPVSNGQPNTLLRRPSMCTTPAARRWRGTANGSNDGGITWPGRVNSGSPFCIRLFSPRIRGTDPQGYRNLRPRSFASLLDQTFTMHATLQSCR